jgi:SAM-dependent methyltransferase
MTGIKDVSRHYTSGALLERIDAALREGDADPDHIGVDDLKPVDEFHTGGFEATTALLDQLTISPGMTVLDIGCGLGGTARHIVHRYGANVIGVDLTEEFVETAKALNARLHLEKAIDMHVGSALEVPLQDASADLVCMFHVGMNIADKDPLFAEVARVLKPGGQYALFDVMEGESGLAGMAYPVPWAGSAELSHLHLPGTYRRAAHAAGLSEHAERDRSAFALDYFDRVFRMIEANGLPPLGIHLLMGETAGEKIQNYVENVKARRIAPTEMIFEKPEET